MKQPVLVVGAGPVGMTMAAALKRLGVDVRIIDRAAARTDKSKALVLWPRTLELLDIQGCVQGFLDAGLHGKGAAILAEGREVVRVATEMADSPYKFMLLLPQSETERLLEAELTRLGVTVERQVDLQSFTLPTVDLLHQQDMRHETAEFGWIIGCDGAHSTVRHQLGLAFEGKTEPSEWVLADVFLDGDVAAEELTICWQPDGILAIFPIIGSRFRVIAETGGSEADPTLADIQRLLEARGPPGLRARDPVWLSRFRINERKVKAYSQGHAYLAGDAAHVHSPAGGQGMNTGMQDAFNLAWKLALVWHGRASPALLDSYSTERSAIGDQVLRNATQMTRVAVIRNPILQQLRNTAVGVLGHLPMLRQRLVDQLCELDLHYPDSPLTGAGGGHRAPDVVTSAGRLHEVLRDGRFVVLSVGVEMPALPPEVAALAVSAQATADRHYAAGQHYVIRPDAYVSMVSCGDVVAFLRGWR